jgi:hypothetical protein
MSYKIIPSEVHGYLDYLLALFCIAYTVFSDLYASSQIAFYVSILCSFFFVFQASITKFKPSFFKWVPMNIHLFNDTMAALVFFATPFILELQGLHFVYFILVSIGILAVGFTTNKSVAMSDTNV